MLKNNYGATRVALGLLVLLSLSVSDAYLAKAEEATGRGRGRHRGGQVRRKGRGAPRGEMQGEKPGQLRKMVEDLKQEVNNLKSRLTAVESVLYKMPGVKPPVPPRISKPAEEEAAMQPSKKEPVLTPQQATELERKKKQLKVHEGNLARQEALRKKARSELAASIDRLIENARGQISQLKKDIADLEGTSEE